LAKQKKTGRNIINAGFKLEFIFSI